MNKSKILILMILFAFLFAACDSMSLSNLLQIQQLDNESNDNIYKADYDILDKGPVAGGVLNLFTTKPDTLNPLTTKNTYIADLLSFIYEGLTKLDETQQAIPGLSDEWTVSDDGLIWNFHIREDVKWHDGQPFTAEDVEFTMQMLLTPGIDSIYTPLLKNVLTFAAIDSFNFRMILEKPNSFTPEMMTFPVIPKDQTLSGDIFSSTDNFKPVGTGPYKFISYTENENIVLSSYEHWWKLPTEADTDKESMYIETINAKIFKSHNEAMAALHAGQIDLMEIQTNDFNKYKGRTDVIVKKYTSRNFEFLSLNLNNKVIADVYARRAISLAIDREKIVNDTLLGDAVASDLPVLHESWIRDYQRSSVYTPDVSMSTDALSAKTPKEVLEMGNWKQNQQGYYKVIDGVRKYLNVEIIVNSNNSIRVKTAEKICSMLEQAGIHAVCIQLEWNDYITRLTTYKYEIAMTGCRIPQIPDISYLYSENYFSGTLLVDDAVQNVSGYNNTRVNTNIESMFAGKNRDEIKRIFSNTADILKNDTPYIGLYFLRDSMVYSKNIRGPLTPHTWDTYSDIRLWYKLELP